MPAVATLSEDDSERTSDGSVISVDKDEDRTMTPDRIARIRDRAGWTLQEMGETLGVTRQAVSAWERGVRTPNEYQQVLLQRIEAQLDQRDQQQREQFVQAITGIAAGAGIAALFSFLFSDSNSGNSGDSEPTDQSQ